MSTETKSFCVRLRRSEYTDVIVEAVDTGDAYCKMVELIEDETVADYAPEWELSEADGISIGAIREATKADLIGR
jgi:hypothetical protein